MTFRTSFALLVLATLTSLGGCSHSELVAGAPGSFADRRPAAQQGEPLVCGVRQQPSGALYERSGIGARQDAGDSCTASGGGQACGNVYCKKLEEPRGPGVIRCTLPAPGNAPYSGLGYSVAEAEDAALWDCVHHQAQGCALGASACAPVGARPL